DEVRAGFHREVQQVAPAPLLGGAVGATMVAALGSGALVLWLRAAPAVQGPGAVQQGQLRIARRRPQSWFRCAVASRAYRPGLCRVARRANRLGRPRLGLPWKTRWLKHRVADLPPERPGRPAPRRNASPGRGPARLRASGYEVVARSTRLIPSARDPGLVPGPAGSRAPRPAL